MRRTDAHVASFRGAFPTHRVPELSTGFFAQPLRKAGSPACQLPPSVDAKYPEEVALRMKKTASTSAMVSFIGLRSAIGTAGGSRVEGFVGRCREPSEGGVRSFRAASDGQPGFRWRMRFFFRSRANPDYHSRSWRSSARHQETDAWC